MPVALPKIKIGDKEFFVDERLQELRNMKNPNDKIACETQEFTIDDQEQIVMVCKADITLEIDRLPGGIKRVGRFTVGEY